jgi:ketosteroid isomerase-like protein
MTNVDIVKQGYSNFATGNVEAVLTTFDPEIEWHECTGMPFVKDDGIYKGPQAVVNNVFMNLPVYFDGFNIAVDQIIGANDKVVMVGYYNGINKATGNPFKANATHVWTFKNGKCVYLFQAVDTHTMVS